MQNFNLNVEQVAALRTQERYAHLPQLFRLDQSAGRHYYTVDPKRDPAIMYYPSWTTVIKRICGTSEHLVKWTAEMGYDEAKRYMNDRADYGTSLHIILAELMTQRSFDLGLIKAKAGAYLLRQNKPTAVVDVWAPDLEKDVLAFAQFVADKEVEIEAVEIPMVSEAMGIAGTIDIVCTLKFGKSRVRAIVDIKSGRKGFYSEHKYQLHGYMAMHNENVADESDHVSMVFNWSPKDWQKAPTYNLENQTDALEGTALSGLVHQHKALYPEPKKSSIIRARGTVQLGTAPTDCFEIVDVDRLLRVRHQLD